MVLATIAGLKTWVICTVSGMILSCQVSTAITAVWGLSTIILGPGPPSHMSGDCWPVGMQHEYDSATVSTSAWLLHAGVMRNVNTVQMEELSPEIIAAARARRSRERWVESVQVTGYLQLKAATSNLCHSSVKQASSSSLCLVLANNFLCY